MNNNVEIYYVINSGLIFSCDDASILVDGIVRDDNLFGIQSDDDRNQLIQAFKTCNSEKIMLFTHCHNDHFDDRGVISIHDEVGFDKVIVPRDTKDGLGVIALSEQDSRIEIVDGDCSFETDKVKIRYFETEHLKYQGFDKVNHYAVAIEIGGKSYLIMGDAMPAGWNNVLEETAGKMDGVFIGPLALGRKAWAEELYRAYPDACIYMYHMPDEGMPAAEYGSIGMQKYKEYNNLFKNIKLLNKKMQII